MRIPGSDPITLTRATISGIVICVGCAQQTPQVIRPEEQELETQVATYLEQYIGWAEDDPMDAQRHATLGVVYEANELWPEARACFRTVIDLAPKEILARYHEALACQEIGDLEETVELLHGISIDDPSFAAAHHRLGQLLLKKNELDKAVRSFKQTIDLMPDHVEGYLGMADIMLRRNDHAAAETFARQALELNQHQAMAWYLLGQALRTRPEHRKEATRALRAGTGAVVTYLPDPWSKTWPIHAKGLADQMRLAHDLSAAGHAAKAVNVLEEALFHRPGNVDVLNNLAVLLRRAGQPESALEHLEQARANKPDSFATHINIAACFLDLGRFEQALRSAERAILLFPSDAQAHITKAHVLLAQKRLDESLLSAVRAQELASDEASTHLTVARVLLQQLQAESALSACNSAAEISPLALEPVLCQHQALSILGKTNEALAVVQEARKLHSGNKKLASLVQHIETKEDD